MISAPRLLPADVREKLDDVFKRPHRSRMVAFYGTGEETTVETTHEGRFRLLPVASELALRAALPPLTSDDKERIAFLVPFPDNLPLDIAGRFALGGRVLRVGPDARLRRLFGAIEIDEAARASALAEFILAHGDRSQYASSGGRLTRDVLWLSWLNAELGLDSEGELSAGGLLAWAALSGKGPSFVERMERAGGPAVREELYHYLEERLGRVGPLIWRAWEANRARAVLEYAILFEVLAVDPRPDVAMWVRMKTQGELGVPADDHQGKVVRDLGSAVEPALRSLQRHAREEMHRWVHPAQLLVDQEPVRAALITSRRLPVAWDLRLSALGAALLRAAESPSAKAVSDAAECLERLEAHDLFQDPAYVPTAQRAEMAVRLAAWLAERPDRRIEPGQTSYAEVVRLARWYAEEGGYVDWARRRARGSASGAFGAGVQAIVAAADEARTELDRGFAGALPEWHRSGRPSSEVVPIEHAVRRIAVPFLKERPERRLLVLLLDGMAWAQAVELLESLGSGSQPWGPLAWHGGKTGRIGAGMYPPVLAAVPTMTEISRAAFFGGKEVSRGEKLGTERDPDRWAKNKDVLPMVEAHAAPRLLLRSEGHTPDGSASAEALNLVCDPSQRIVAIVINAIDASLKGDTQEGQVWTAGSIRSLPSLLEAARDSGRAVLLASDHGHVPGDRLESVGSPAGAGARWRSLRSLGDPYDASYEVVFTDNVWAERGHAGVVLLADDAHRYGSAAHAGEHGGATLAEVVAPTLLIGSESLANLAVAGAEDPGVVVRPRYVPRWWHREVRSTSLPPELTGPSAQPLTPQAAPAVTKPAPQLSLPGLPAPEPSTPPKATTKPKPPPAEPIHPLAVALASAEAFQTRGGKRQRERALRAVAYLAERNGHAPVGAFATAMEELDYRVAGLVSTLAEVLNWDGYAVIRLDASGKHVELDIETLKQLFELQGPGSRE
jgi:hypothetical protein